MDSKIKKAGIFIGLIALVALMAFAVVINYQKLMEERKTGKSNTNDASQASEKSYIEADGKVHGADLSAFLSDSDFFDDDSAASETTGDGVQNNQNISLVASSVERDIRIKVVDDEGNPITGYGFAVKVENTGVYLDEDENGLIVITDMKPGQYKVSLNEIEGFNVPQNPLNVKVKSSVTYTVIDDISYFLHEDSEVDALSDDIIEKDMDAEDEDDSQYTTLLDIEDEKDSAIALGIDVSKYQGDIDWELVKAEGVDFAIIRCGYRGCVSGWLVEDSYFYKNIQAAKSVGIKVGIYFVTQALNKVEAVEEASAAIALLSGTELDFPIFIDVEAAGGNGRADNLDASTRTEIINAFCKTVEDSGYMAGVYSNRYWYYNNIYADEISGYNIWLAEYVSSPLYTGKYDLWQYTSSGTVAGIEGRVDLDVSYLGIK